MTDLVPATPWDERRTKGLRREGYSMLKGGRDKMLRAAWDAGIRDHAELWEIAHAPGIDRYGFWWSDPDYLVGACGTRETPIPPHGFANILYWLQHGRMFRPDGGIPFVEGEAPIPSFLLKRSS